MNEDIPKPNKGQVLIKVAYSTINPYDRNMYLINKEEGFVLGSDGCGTIISVGEEVDPSLIGKKVAFLRGAWSHFTV